MRASLTLSVLVLLAGRTAWAQPPAASPPPRAQQAAATEQPPADESARQAVLPGATAPAPRLTVPTISMADAVMTTVANGPQIKLGIQQVSTRSGSVQRERGLFDWKLIVTPSLEYSNLALDPGTRQNESDRRLKLAIVAAAFGSINRQLLDQINDLRPRPPRCPLEFAELRDIRRLNIDDFSFKIRGLRGFEDTFFTVGGVGGRGTSQTFKSACLALDDRRSVSNTVYTTLDDPNNNIFRRMFGLATGRSSVRELLTGAGLQEAIITLEQAPHEILGVTQQFSQAASAQAILALQRLGVVPVDAVIKTSRMDTRLTRLFRNGITFGTTMHFDTSLDNFKDKSLDPFYGGSGKPMFFRANATGDVTIPLMRNRGIGTTANERAAQLSLNAENDRLRFTVSEESFRTATAYLGLIAAQESVRSLEESLARQTRITQLTQQRIAGGDLPAVEIARSQARTAAVATSLSQARTAVVDARIALAEAMGVDADSIANAPLAAENFAMTPKTLPAVDELMAIAAQSRLDARALGSLREAARVLEEGALVNAKPRIDLFAKAGMGTFFDNLTFFHDPDEINPIFTLLRQDAPPQPTSGAVRFSSPIGFYRAMFTRKWRPLWNVNLTLDVPFRNNRQRGAYVQAQAARQRAEVQERDLLRIIRENVVNQVESLRLRAEAIQLGQAAVNASITTVDGAIARFQTGDQTLFDTLLAEEDLTQDRLALVNLWQAYLSDLVRLRFETGTLVSFSGAAVDQIQFNPAEFVAR